jgi:glycosyltransferase involved in cell wall biosynthesis
MNKKRLLICVQAVDLDDPLMGFFVTWLEEAAKSFERITVLALRVGRYTLPESVTVVPLRANGSHSKIGVICRLLKEVWLRRGAYDAVFVRGDPQYILLAGWLWRLLGKRIVFWYAHWKVRAAAVLASRIAHLTVTSVKTAFEHSAVNAIPIGQNVDHRRFLPRVAPNPGPFQCLAFGSVRPIKRIDYAVLAFLQAEGERAGATLTIVGPRTDAVYEALLKDLAKGHSTIHWDEGVAYDQVPGLLAKYDLTINACPGSLDKVILEAMMSGQVVIASTDGILDWLPERLHWLYAPSLEDLTIAVRRALSLTPEERFALGAELRVLAIEHHSLEGQVQKLAALLEQK